MKNKAIFLLTAIIVLFLAFLLFDLDDGSGQKRVHQHLQPLPETIEEGTKTVTDMTNFSTHLPIVCIDTNGEAIPGAPILGAMGEDLGDTVGPNGETEIKAGFQLFYKQGRMNQTSSKADVKSKIRIRYRGNSSRFFDKKPYSIHLINEDGSENPKKLAGMSSADEWVLNGPFLDRTLIRNYLCYNVSGEIMEYAPNVRYCELFVNGQYQGIYLIVENITRGKGRIDINKPMDRKAQTSYIVRWDRSDKGDHLLNNFTYYTGQNGVSALDVKYPGANLINDARMKFIEHDISHIEKVLYSYDLTDPNIGYDQYLDQDSFAEYFVINEFFRNVDAGRFSTFYYKDVKGKLKLCVWDFNNACDNYIDYPWDESGFSMQNAPWFEMLLKDENFVRLVAVKYRALRETYLSDEYLLSYIDETAAFLGDAKDRNYQAWGYVFLPTKTDGANYLSPLDRNARSYEESINQLKTFIQKRGQWLDEHIDILYQYCSESKTRNTLIK